MVILTYVNRNYQMNVKYLIYLINKLKNIILYNYMYYEYKKFKDYFIEYCYDNNILKKIIYSNDSGKIHREDGYAYISYHINGKINIKAYYLNGKEYSCKNYVVEVKKLV